MELISGVVFIGAVIIAVTQFIKSIAPNVNGAVTIAVAVVVGIVVALLDTHIGVVDISVAQGILIALGAVGVHTTVSQIG